MKLILLLSLLSVFIFPLLRHKIVAVGIFDNQQDIGYVKHAGSTAYDPATQILYH